MTPVDIIDIAKPQTRVEAIAEGLIRYIAERGLRGGDRLPSERQLVEMIDATRLPLREALCVLKGMGILESKHGKGVFVKELDLANIFSMLSPLLRSQADIDLPQLFEARFHLEGTVAELAATNHDGNLERLSETVEGMRAAIENRPEYMRLDTAFHQELAALAGNQIYRIFMASLSDLLTALQLLYIDDIRIRRQAVEEHAEVLEAVRVRDGQRAKAAIQKHLTNATKRIQHDLRELEKPRHTPR